MLRSEINDIRVSKVTLHLIYLSICIWQDLPVVIFLSTANVPYTYHLYRISNICGSLGIKQSIHVYLHDFIQLKLRTRWNNVLTTNTRRRCQGWCTGGIFRDECHPGGEEVSANIWVTRGRFVAGRKTAKMDNVQGGVGTMFVRALRPRG